MNNNLKTILSAACDAEEKQNIDAVAKSCYTSTMQLHRVFYNLTGYSVGEYMRHLRLSHALCRIKASEAPLADIAYSCGYSSQQALCREIKSLLGITATEYRNRSEYYFLSELDDTRFITEVSKTTVPPTACLKYYSPMLRGIENNAVRLFLKKNPDYSGRLFGRNGRQRGNMFCYELYAEMCNGLHTDGFDISGEFDGYVTSCAQIRVKNADDEISAAWDYLYAEWLPKSMFEYAGRNNDQYENHYFEEYIYKNAGPVRLKLCLPLARKSGYLKVKLEHELSMLFLVSTKQGFHAEKRASRTVIDSLTRNYPYIVRNTKEFFYRQQGSSCTCGVRINAGIETCRDLRTIRYQNQAFAVLCFGGISDYEQSCKILTNWLCENGIEQEGEPFAVYDASESYENPSMRLYCPVKNVRI